nr:hypothetical protein Iba_chr15fCG2190 [Ipomoea batatas]
MDLLLTWWNPFGPYIVIIMSSALDEHSFYVQNYGAWPVVGKILPRVIKVNYISCTVLSMFNA